MLTAWVAGLTAQTELPGFDAPGADDATLTLLSEFAPAKADRPARLFITATIKPGWHIYSITQPPGGPIPTEIKLTPSKQFKLLGDFKAYPKPKVEQEPIAFPGVDVESHEGKVTWHAPLEFDSGIDPAAIKIEGQVTFQACQADSCIPPQTIPFTAIFGKGVDVPPDSQSVAVPVAVKPDKPAIPPKSNAPKNANTARKTGPSTKTGSLWMHLGWAFLGGLILNLMPCVLPVISLKLLSFMKQAGENRMRVFTLNLWYSAGLLSVFIVLAALAAGGASWGEQFTKPWFKVAMTGLVFSMGLSFLGVWQIPIPGFVGSGKAIDLQQQEGPSGAFFKGVFTTILATPCSGPFLGPIFGYLLNQPPYMAYVIFGGVGLGMASPYLLIGAFPKLIGFLPKPGAWMKTFEELMGFFMLAAVIYLFTTLSSPYFIPTFTLLIGLWFAFWLIGRTPITAEPSTRLMAWIGGTLLAVVFGIFGFAFLFDIAEVKYVGEDSVAASGENGKEKFGWHRFSPAALAKARAEGKTVMVDFWAKWCPTCQVNSKVAIETDAVSEVIKKNNVVPMLADWTDESPVIKKALNDLGYNSIPLLAIWPANPQDQEVIVLPDLLSESEVIEALHRAGPSK
ncbi:MAG: thioredoxin family protein [Pirellulales bacterium]|nr:thioredoxin family protein [Pirellulales bacterium]